MAALIPDARAACLEARRLRGELQTLKHALRESAADSREQCKTANAALELLEARRGQPLPSPWSTLHWSHDHRSLSGVLVLLP